MTIENFIVLAAIVCVLWFLADAAFEDPLKDD
jgi:hypothetical protein